MHISDNARKALYCVRSIMDEEGAPDKARAEVLERWGSATWNELLAIMLGCMIEQIQEKVQDE